MFIVQINRMIKIELRELLGDVDLPTLTIGAKRCNRVDQGVG